MCQDGAHYNRSPVISKRQLPGANPSVHENRSLLPHAAAHLLESSGFTSINMKRVQVIAYSTIVRTRNHSDTILDSNIINSSLTLVDLSWASDAMRGIIH